MTTTIWHCVFAGMVLFTFGCLMACLRDLWEIYVVDRIKEKRAKA